MEDPRGERLYELLVALFRSDEELAKLYGGAGLDYVTYAIICEEVGRGCSAMRTVVSVQTSLVCSTLVKWGTEEQKQKYLPKLCSGEWLGCFGLTEPDTGSDAANQKTRARKTDDGWSISGSKQWITNGSFAGTVLLFARTDPETPGPKGVSAFILDGDQVRVTREEEKLGLNSSSTSDLAIEDAEVGRDRLLHEEGKGFAVAMATLDIFRSTVGAAALGFAMIWYIWWLAGSALAGIFGTTIFHTFNYKRDFHIPVEDVIASEDARTRQLATQGA